MYFKHLTLFLLFFCGLFGVSCACAMSGAIPWTSIASTLFSKSPGVDCEKHARELAAVMTGGVHSVYTSLIADGAKKGLGDESAQLCAVGRYALEQKNDVLLKQVNDQLVVQKTAKLEHAIANLRWVAGSALACALVSLVLNGCCIWKIRSSDDTP